MTRRDYELVARIFKEMPPGPGDALDDVIHEFAKQFKRENSAFNAEKFLRACYGRDR